MMDLNCPGSKSLKDPVPEIFTCPNCDEEVEIWSHERMRKCGSCGTNVVRELDSTWCVQWCRYAKECIGVEKYEEMLEAGLISEDNKEETNIPERLKEFMEESGVPVPDEDTSSQDKKSE
ncbi:hypothetical protein ACFL6S_19495 [Candidatus Poribacteria bacterium]